MIPTLDQIRAHFQGVRFIPDVHGDTPAFLLALQEARAMNYYVVQLGDLIDYGPDAVGCLDLAMDLVANGKGTVLLGNHDYALMRYCEARWAGNKPPKQMAGELGKSVAQLEALPGGRKQLLDVYWSFLEQCPLWIRVGRYLAAHGAHHPAMDWIDPPSMRAGASRTYITPTIYGYVDPTATRPDGLPVRSYEWIDFIDATTTMVVGHDIRSRTAPVVETSFWGGTVIFLDTGCSKDGFLSVLDVRAEDLGEVPY